MNSQLRFGIVGLSPGNGHPYSWSAICNGYDPEEMSRCPFPAIPRYLRQQQFPADAIPDVCVTHVWTQDRQVSKQIAAASRIEHVADEPEAMIGAVDAVLLARDDAENHFRLAAPFLDAGLPIYIDKPLALSVAGAHALYRRQVRPGQIFTCSALSYAPELALALEQLGKLGALIYVDGYVPNGWDTYAIHAIEPLLKVIDRPVSVHRAQGVSPRHVDLVWNDGLTGRVTALGQSQVAVCLRFFTQGGVNCVTFQNSFAAFKAALLAFIAIVRGQAPPQDPATPLAAIQVLEAGRAHA